MSFGRFMATFAIVALGVGFLSGLLATTPDLKLSMDRYFDRLAMMDIFIKATAGISAADIEALAARDDVEAAAGAYVTDAVVSAGGGDALVARIFGLPAAPDGGGVNRLELVEGRLPQAKGECLVQEGGGFFASVPPGTRLAVLEETLRYVPFASLGEIYAVTEFVVTGVARSPLFISTGLEPSGAGAGRLDLALYAGESCYALPAYTDAYLTVKGAAETTAFTQAYRKRVEPVRARLEAFGLERSRLRRAELEAFAREAAGARLAEGEAGYARARALAEARLGRARAGLDAGARQAEEGRAALERAALALEEGRAALDAEEARAEAAFAENERALDSGAAALAAARERLAESAAVLAAAREEAEKTRASPFRMRFAKARAGVAEYDAGIAAWETGEAAVAEKEAELRRGREALEAGRREAAAAFARGRADAAAAEAEVAGGRRDLDAAARDLARGEADYEAGRREALRELRDGAAALEEARRAVAGTGVPLPQWYVLDRSANAGCATYQANAEKIADVAKVFPLFFLLIATLVALTTMTRMVEEDRVHIGALKALGYRKRAILLKYLAYCALTGVLGSAAGMAAGFRGLPVVIYGAFSSMARLPPLVTVFDWPFGLLACAAVLACTSGAAVYACYRTLWEKPAALLLPRPPVSGKRVFLEYAPFLWKRMKFTHKITARNLIRQKKHFVMTVAGIAGCTALVLAAFGLRDSLLAISRTQFEEIFLYDAQAGLRAGAAGLPAETRAGLDALLPDKTAVHTESVTLVSGALRLPATLMEPEDPAAFPRFIALRDRKTRRPLDLSASGIILAEKAAEYLGLRPGSPFVIEDARGARRDVTLGGVTENYVGAFAYSAPGAEEPPGGYRTLLARAGVPPAEYDAVSAALLALDGVTGAAFTARTRETYDNLLHSVGFVAVVLIFAAGGLAMIVLYNLTDINITERAREIATLRVLGFRRSEAAAYIFREIAVLSVAGTAAGLCAGVPLHAFITGVAETADLMFGRRVAPESFVLSAAVTLFFSLCVDLCMLKKIRDVKMAASMKIAD